jgi:hypothetical protein
VGRDSGDKLHRSCLELDAPSVRGATRLGRIWFVLQHQNKGNDDLDRILPLWQYKDARMRRKGKGVPSPLGEALVFSLAQGS